MRSLAATLLTALALGACHKQPDAEAASSRGLQVEAYDPVIPKSPVKGKLETMTRRPQTAEAVTASSEPPSESSTAPEPKT